MNLNILLVILSLIGTPTFEKIEEYFENISQPRVITNDISDEWLFHGDRLDIRSITKKTVIEGPMAKDLALVLSYYYLRDLSKDNCFSMFYAGRVKIVDNIKSYLILMKLRDSDVGYLYLVNMRDSCITSTARLSYDFFVSESNYGHQYTDINKDSNMAVYELYYYVCDVIADQTPIPVSLSFFDKIRYWFLSFFYREKLKYDYILNMKLNQDGTMNVSLSEGLAKALSSWNDNSD